MIIIIIILLYTAFRLERLQANAVVAVQLKHCMALFVLLDFRAKEKMQFLDICSHYLASKLQEKTKQQEITLRRQKEVVIILKEISSN